MKTRTYLLSIGVMTGNSLDGADAVLTRFDDDGQIQDLKSYNLKSPPELTERLQHLRDVINDCQGEMQKSVIVYNSEAGKPGSFDNLVTTYVKFVAESIKGVIDAAKADSAITSKYDLDQIDLIGFHGQTCAHLPPSVAKSDNPDSIYTCQIGDGQLLADLTGITVVYDFRSDDLMNGGEAAPLAPIHHQHLAELAKLKGQFPLAFCNAGNTGNISIISVNTENNQLAVIGWDTGPFNNYPDKLVQKERGQECDWNGTYGANGRINEKLLRLLFDTAVTTNDGENFLLRQPPKSSDPQWYKLLPELIGKAPIDGQILSFEDRLRTAEYLAAYIYMHSLTLIPSNIQMPEHFALCGGGWKNPVSHKHFVELLQGDLNQQPILPEHRRTFGEVRNKIGKPNVNWSEHYGFDGTAMEARIFADAAVCRIKGVPFSNNSTTGAKDDTVAGIIRFPNGDAANATKALSAKLVEHDSHQLTKDHPVLFDRRWSRASAGWHQTISRLTHR